MATEKDKVPPARSRVQGLRCIGYNFSTAIADIIDNSISANARLISVFYNPNCAEPYLTILDDGCGRDESELDNARTLGSDRENKPDSETELGRFGLGLKSASFSQCTKLTVVSKKNGTIHARRYDLDKILTENKWVLEILDDSEREFLPEFEKLKEQPSGTLVIWQSFDKLKESSSDFKKSFLNACCQAREHVEWVFHRFYGQVSITFNGKPMEKRDPFLIESCPRTQKGRTQNIVVDGQTITVTPFVLPYANKLTAEERALLGNPKSINDQQGFYIYRNKRLIISGGWLRRSIRSELSKLARVRVDVPSTLDSVWMLDVKKSSASIPDKVKSELQRAVQDSVIKSTREVSYKGKKEAESECPFWLRLTDEYQNKVTYVLNRESNPVYSALILQLDEKQKRLLTVYLNDIEASFPKQSLILDNANSNDIVNPHEEDDEEKMISELVELSSLTENKRKFIEKLLLSPCYSKLLSKEEEIIERAEKYGK